RPLFTRMPFSRVPLRRLPSPVACRHQWTPSPLGCRHARMSSPAGRPDRPEHSGAAACTCDPGAAGSDQPSALSAAATSADWSAAPSLSVANLPIADEMSVDHEIFAAAPWASELTTVSFVHEAIAVCWYGP